MALAKLAAAAVAASIAVSGSALALEKPGGFPDRPLTIIVPFGAGGGSDNVSRAWASAMQPIIGQPLQVVNMPGGGGLGALPEFMAATKDGYTVLQTIDSAIADHVAGRLPQNPATDWAPLCATQITFNQVYINGSDDRFSNWEEFADYASQNRVTVALVGGPGTSKRLIMDLLNEELDLRMSAVAFDRPSERFGALVGGQVDALISQPGDTRSFVDEGEFVPILTVYDERPDAFADVPTHREVGADFAPLLRFRGFWSHPDVPAERREYLEQACAMAFEDENYQAFNEQNFMHLIDSFRDAEGFRAMIEETIEIYREALQ